MNGQISIFEFIQPVKKRTLNDYWHAEAIGQPIRLTSEELQAEQNRLGIHAYWYFATDVPKCCGCYPMLKVANRGFNDLYYAECLVCGNKTKPIDDYSWQGTRKAWIELIQ